MFKLHWYLYLSVLTSLSKKPNLCSIHLMVQAFPTARSLSCSVPCSNQFRLPCKPVQILHTNNVYQSYWLRIRINQLLKGRNQKLSDIFLPWGYLCMRFVTWKIFCFSFTHAYYCMDQVWKDCLYSLPRWKNPKPNKKSISFFISARGLKTVQCRTFFSFWKNAPKSIFRLRFRTHSCASRFFVKT